MRDDAYVQETLTDLWGIPADTQLYLHPIVDGRWYHRSRARRDRRHREPGAGSRPADGRQDSGRRAETGADVRHRRHRGRREHLSRQPRDGKSLHDAGERERPPRPPGCRGCLRRALQRQYAQRVWTRHSERLEEQFRPLAPSALAAYEDRANTQNTIRILTVLLDAMVIVVAVIGVMGLVNTLVLNITERRRELGILRSIGAGGGALMRLLVSEGLVLGIARLRARLWSAATCWRAISSRSRGRSSSGWSSRSPRRCSSSRALLTLTVAAGCQRHAGLACRAVAPHRGGAL